MTYPDSKSTEIVREALLEDGRIVEYDVCSRDKQAFSGLKYRILGKGTTYSINGVRQTDNNPKWFWVKKENK
jgi:hypothetical protein